MLLAGALAKACALLTAAEIGNVQGEKPARMRGSNPQRDSSHCFIALPTRSKSVRVEVTRGARVAQLAERLRVAAQVEGEEAGEEDVPAIATVQGLGDEAFW